MIDPQVQSAAYMLRNAIECNMGLDAETSAYTNLVVSLGGDASRLPNLTSEGRVAYLIALMLSTGRVS